MAAPIGTCGNGNARYNDGDIDPHVFFDDNSMPRCCSRMIVCAWLCIWDICILGDARQFELTADRLAVQPQQHRGIQFFLAYLMLCLYTTFP